MIAGATGLIGGHVLRRLLAHPSYARVGVLVRRELPISHPKFVQRLVDFEHLDADLAAAMIHAANHDVPSGPIDSDEIVRLAQRENAGQ